MTQPNWQETLVKDIMQDGFDVAMGGNPSESEEWNKLWGEKEYDLLVAKYSNLIGEKINQAVLEERERIADFLSTHLTDSGANDELSIGYEAGIKTAIQALQDEGKGLNETS